MIEYKAWQPISGVGSIFRNLQGIETSVRLKSANMAISVFNDRCRNLNTCRVYLKLLQVIFILCYSGCCEKYFECLKLRREIPWLQQRKK